MKLTKNTGSIEIDKGNVESVPLVTFDAVPSCEERCSIYEACPFSNVNVKCKLRRKYIEAVTKSIMIMVPKKDEITMHKVGFFLIPLYTHLVSLKIEILGMNQAVLIGKVVRANPLYKEIRDTIRLINQILNEVAVPENVRTNTLLDGDSEYYQTLMTTGELPLSAK